MIISFVQTKGGTGKSTLSLCMAFSETLQKACGSIALVELDTQGTLQNWWNEREDEEKDTKNVSFHHISSTQKKVFQEGIRTIAAHNELIIMDIPGESKGRLHTRFACAVSDIVVIPMRTTTNDEAAFTDNLLPIVREVVNVAPERKNSFFVLPAFVHPMTGIRKVKDYFSDILPDTVGCLDAVFPARSVFENFNRNGATLDEYSQSVKNNKRFGKQAETAVSDIEKIAKAVLEKRRPHGHSEKP